MLLRARRRQRGQPVAASGWSATDTKMTCSAFSPPEGSFLRREGSIPSHPGGAFVSFEILGTVRTPAYEPDPPLPTPSTELQLDADPQAVGVAPAVTIR